MTTRVTYIADDGMEFDAEEECLLHEKGQDDEIRETLLCMMRRLKHRKDEYGLPYHHLKYMEAREGLIRALDGRGFGEDEMYVLSEACMRVRIARGRLEEKIEEYRGLKQELREINEKRASKMEGGAK